ncbi:MAG: T9SS type A sorting domain-containing protein [Crocinitomicaceae bacterium]|nr:T9SS type A sorting domain-containing protein [Flavobacteriales bacterium]NQZ35958.1 T9SS type A sorting domain-containing protein [Crocinitomicaceae bacterium]
MKQKYLVLCLSLFFCASKINAQVVNQIYDHDTTDLSQLHNMPFNETKMLVVSGFAFAPAGLTFHELDQSSGQLIDLTFTNVDTILSTPEFKDDKFFFEASINGLGRELVAYDGTSTYFFDFNTGAGSSNPEIFEFENEIYVIANDGAIRQLYKYAGGTSFEQISEEIENDVDIFIANRGDEYYYITFSIVNGRAIKSTLNNNGILTHSTIVQTSWQESLVDVVLLNGDIFMLSGLYTFVDASYRVDKIDLSNTITTHHFETGSQYSSGSILAFDGDILFYRTDPGHTEILNVSTAQQPFVQVSIDPAQYNLIGNHVVQNDKLFIYGVEYILDVSGSTPLPIIEDGSVIQLSPAFETDSSFFVYEIAPFSSGEISGIIEVSSITNQYISYEVSNEGGFFSYSSPMVVNNGEVKFIFKTEGSNPSTDIYSFSSILAIDENDLVAFELFPNPSVNGHFKLVLPQPGKVNIYTLEGQIIQSMDLDLGINEVNVKNLTTGIYLVEYNNKVQRLFVN